MIDDKTALLRGIAANPQADLPRLVYADWLEERYAAEQAAFIRAQVEYSQTPAWEPFAVYCRHRRREWFTGEDWLDTLPELDPSVAVWSPIPFHRGLGYSVEIRSVASFLDIAEELFRIVPIGKLRLPTATLADWRRFCEQPWLGQIESISFYGLDSPIEPIREFCRHADQMNLKQLVFEQSSRPGIPVLLEDVVQSQLGTQLRSIHLKVGPHDSEHLIEALVSGDAQLDELLLNTHQLSELSLDMLAQSPMFRKLKSLQLTHCYCNSDLLTETLSTVPFQNLEKLTLQNSRLNELNIESIGLSKAYLNLKELDITGASIDARSWQNLLLAPYWTNLRSFRAAHTGLMGTPFLIRELIEKGRFWDHLVELDLRDDFTSPLSVEELVLCEAPPELTALLIRKPHQRGHSSGGVELLGKAKEFIIMEESVTQDFR